MITFTTSQARRRKGACGVACTAWRRPPARLITEPAQGGWYAVLVRHDRLAVVHDDSGAADVGKVDAVDAVRAAIIALSAAAARITKARWRSGIKIPRRQIKVLLDGIELMPDLVASERLVLGMATEHHQLSESPRFDPVAQRVATDPKAMEAAI